MATIDTNGALHDSLGRYAEQNKPCAGYDLPPASALAPGVVSVQDSGGDWADLTPGVIDGEAEWVYLHGQCLALAAAGSKRTGWPVVLHTFKDRDDFDSEAPVVYDNLAHAYLQGPDGSLIDIMGARWGDSQALADSLDEGEALRTVPSGQVEQALAEFDGYLVSQDVEAADTFVTPMLALAGAPDTSRESPYAGLTLDQIADSLDRDYGANEHGDFETGLVLAGQLADDPSELPFDTGWVEFEHTEIETVPARSLVASQDTVNVEGVAKYLSDPTRESVSAAPVRAVRYEGDLVILDGHHRAVAAALRCAAIEVEIDANFEPVVLDDDSTEEFDPDAVRW